MFRKFALSGLIAAAIATAPVATTPARAADAHDIIGGAIALGIIGAIINDINDINDRPPPQRVYRKPVPTYQQQYNTHRHGNVTQRPKECLRQKRVRGGWEKYYSGACLRKYGY